MPHPSHITWTLGRAKTHRLVEEKISHHRCHRWLVVVNKVILTTMKFAERRFQPTQQKCWINAELWDWSSFMPYWNCSIILHRMSCKVTALFWISMNTCIESNIWSFDSFEHFVCLCGDLSAYLESFLDLLYLNGHHVAVVKSILVFNIPLERQFNYHLYGIYYMPVRPQAKWGPRAPPTSQPSHVFLKGIYILNTN